jgi:hypothetical protein
MVAKPGARYFRVTVALHPVDKGALAFYLPLLEYDLLASEGEAALNNERLWREVTGPLLLYGNFHFRGRWGRKVRVTGVVTINQEGQSVAVSLGGTQ